MLFLQTIVDVKVDEKWDKYLDMVKELKKFWNLKVPVIQIILGASGTIDCIKWISEGESRKHHF